MEAQARTKLHPLVAGAAIAVIVAAGVAVAAITGYLPGSKADMADSKAVGAQPAKHAPAKQHVAAACHDCGVIVEVKRLRIELPCKRLDLCRVNGARFAGEALPHLKIIEIEQIVATCLARYGHG